MFRYEDFDKEMDSCDICDAQREYLFALSLVGACTKFGK